MGALAFMTPDVSDTSEAALAVGIAGAFYLAIGFFFMLVSALAIVGGIFSIRRRRWGLALAGAIAATSVFFYCGVPAIIFVSMGRSEFLSQNSNPPA